MTQRPWSWSPLAASGKRARESEAPRPHPQPPGRGARRRCSPARDCVPARGPGRPTRSVPGSIIQVRKIDVVEARQSLMFSARPVLQDGECRFHVEDEIIPEALGGQPACPEAAVFLDGVALMLRASRDHVVEAAAAATGTNGHGIAAPPSSTDEMRWYSWTPRP